MKTNGKLDRDASGENRKPGSDLSVIYSTAEIHRLAEAATAHEEVALRMLVILALRTSELIHAEFSDISFDSKVSAKPQNQIEAATAHLNAAAFSNPAAYAYGNAARTAPDGLFAPHIADIDASVRKDLPIFERLKLAIQADVFNLPNRVYFAAPNTTLSSASYGFFTSQGNQPRKFQFGTRMTF